MTYDSRIILIAIGLPVAYWAFGWFVCKVSDIAVKMSMPKERKVKA